MEESEKIMVLKKVYADMLLNTVKEAAGKIMVCERKAFCFQKDATDTKAEAVNMLLRIKQVMDAKDADKSLLAPSTPLISFTIFCLLSTDYIPSIQIADMEITSLKQKSKIEELEAQLNEAEDVVTDLRAQLNAVQDELEKMKKTRLKPLDEQTSKSFAASHENSSHANELKTSEVILLPSLDARWRYNNASSDQRKIGDNCCFTSESVTTPTDPWRKFSLEKCFSGNGDLASIILKSKEPELYRNRYTQRIRAFERNLPDGKSPLLMQTEDQESNLKTGPTTKEDITAEVTCVVTPPREFDVRITEKKSDVMEDEHQAVTPSRRLSSRISTQNKKAVVVPCANNGVQSCELSDIWNVYTCSGNSMAKYRESVPRATEEEVEKNSDSHFHPVSSLDKADIDSLRECSGNKTKTTNEVNVQNTSAEDEPVVDKSELSRQNGEDSLGVQLCKVDHKTVDLPKGSNLTGVEARNTSNEANIQPASDRLIKFTFQRKRKKGSLSDPDENEYQEHNTVKRRAEENQIGALAPHKFSSNTESPDSPRLAQAAHQVD
ncbi:hypothetical protein IFM89_012978 [Coptis chinensis]|uniref:Uncharacterized protein n=1 Tax=Coptis chinensis TaxID=261450 RepID=A0A835M9V8_9MAGN|nr:hypothetical protein IFM89_012978 [Coptis chinensis]